MRRNLSWGCWSAAVVCGFVGGQWSHWLLTTASLLALVGVFLYPVLSLRVTLLPFAAVLGAAGLGVGSYPTVALALCGAVATEIAHGRSRGRAILDARVQQDGMIATGTVIRAWRYWVGAIPMTRVVVHYVDGDGHQRQAKTSADGVVPVGARVRLRYLPEHPATIAVVRS